MTESATDLNRRTFTQQAPTFSDDRFNGVLTGGSDWVFARFPRRQDDVVLDVAAGTGLGALAVAADVRMVVALDLTDAMLEVGRDAAAREGVTNILFMRGDATELPFLSGSFRSVLCRYALHHLPETALAGALAEMRRVLAAGGWLGLADMTVSEDPVEAELANRIERLRDPSHARALSASELQDRLVRTGFEVAGAETREIRRPLKPWLEQTSVSARVATEVRELLAAELAGGAVTGLAPRLESDGDYSFVQTLTSLLVLNPDPSDPRQPTGPECAGRA